MYNLFLFLFLKSVVTKIKLPGGGMMEKTGGDGSMERLRCVYSQGEMKGWTAARVSG